MLLKDDELTEQIRHETKLRSVYDTSEPRGIASRFRSQAVSGGWGEGGLVEKPGRICEASSHAKAKFNVFSTMKNDRFGLPVPGQPGEALVDLQLVLEEWNLELIAADLSPQALQHPMGFFVRPARRLHVSPGLVDLPLQ